jgi:NADH:ubiquinone oxidoreductase subunit H
MARNKLLFNLAPFIAMIVAMLLMAPIAFAKDFQMWDLNIGIFIFLPFHPSWSSVS